MKRGFDLPIFIHIPFMLFFYCIVLIITLSGTFILIRFFIMRKKNLAMELFTKALGHENNGNFTSALELYENALKEVKKVKFHRLLKEKIEHKIKVLHTVMAYNQNLDFVRHSQPLSPPETDTRRNV